MKKIKKLYNSNFLCYNCGEKYALPFYKDDKTGDKMYEYEIILYSTIQTQCPFCKKYNSVIDFLNDFCTTN